MKFLMGYNMKIVSWGNRNLVGGIFPDRGQDQFYG